MKGYIINIILCIFLSLCSEWLFVKKKKALGIFFLFFIILTASFIAGIRNETVGTDIYTYVRPLFKSCGSVYNIFLLSEKFGLEFAFILLVYLFSLFRSLNFVLFGIEFAVVSPIVFYAYLKRNTVPIHVNIFVFLMTMYSFSFSMMRQSIAISFALLATYYIKNNDRKHFYIYTFIAFLFHRTSIIIFLILILCKIIYRKEDKRIIYLFTFVLVFLFAILFSPQMIKLLPIKYANYLGNEYVSSVNIFSAVKKIIWLIPITFYLFRIKNKKSEKYNDLLLSAFLVVIDISIYLIGIKVPTVSRLSLYFSNISAFIYFPYLLKMFKPNLISKILFFTIMIFLWWHMTAYDKSAGIYPYKTDIVPILNSNK